MREQDWPFAESLEEICQLETWTEVSERFAVPPHVAANMRRLGVSNEPSATALPLTVDALSELARLNWPQPAIENLKEEAGRITFNWLEYYFVVYSNLYVEMFLTSRDGEPVDSLGKNHGGYESDLFPRANSATRSFERILQRALDGEPLSLITLDSMAALRLIDSNPIQIFRFWRGTRVGKGQISLCGSHLKSWPKVLGPLRLAYLTPQLHAHLAISSAATINSIGRDLYNHYSGKESSQCRACAYDRVHPTLGPFYALDAIGPAAGGHNHDDGLGPLSRPEYGQPLVTIEPPEEA